MKANFEKGTKVCSRKNCKFVGLEQPISNFGICKDSSDGLNWACKNCCNLSSLIGNRKLGMKQVNIKHRANFETGLKICSNPKCEFGGQVQPLYNFNKNRSKLDGLSFWCKFCQKKYRYDTKEDLKNYRKNRTKEISIYNKQYILINREKITTRRRERRRLNFIEKLKDNLRRRLNRILKQKSFTNKLKLSQYLGCTLPELKLHLENQFQPGMTHENHGYGEDKWHVDHIVALKWCEVYNLDKTLNIELTVKRLCELFHYTNLQPLWQPDNFKKNKNLQII